MGPAAVERFTVKISRLFRFLVLNSWCFLSASLLALGDLRGADGPRGIIVIGAPGEPTYAEAFERQLEGWRNAFERAGAAGLTVIGQGENADGVTDLQRLRDELGTVVTEPARELWIVLIGHGTFDGKEAKFNLRGPDLTVDDLVAWTKPLKQPHALIVASAASAPFLGKLSAPGRIVVVATRSGYEQNYVRFGGYLAEAIGDPEGDLDRDGQTSLLEAFLSAAHRTSDFYKTDRRLMTEHALLDDNGDGLGTPADWFRGTRAIKKTQGGKTLDGARARQWHLLKSADEIALAPQQRERRDALELQIEALREDKASQPELEYWKKLETLLSELAQVYATPASS